MICVAAVTKQTNNCQQQKYKLKIKVYKIQHEILNTIVAARDFYKCD